MQASDHITERPSGVTSKVQLRTFLSRRGRLIRQVSLYLVITMAMLLAAIANRDSQAIRNSAARAQRIADALQREFDELHAPPLHLPSLGPSSGVLPTRYLFNFAYPRMQSVRGVVGVTCPREPTRLFVRADGRHVVLFDGTRYSVQWVRQDEFAASAARWGLDASH